MQLILIRAREGFEKFGALTTKKKTADRYQDQATVLISQESGGLRVYGSGHVDQSLLSLRRTPRTTAFVERLHQVLA